MKPPPAALLATDRKRIEVPKKKKMMPPRCRQNELSTLVVRNVPESWGLHDFISLLWWKGFAKDITFVYVPTHYSSELALGYAIVDTINHTSGEDLMYQIRGLQLPDQKKPFEVEWCHDYQGLHNLVERFRNNNVMHPSIKEAHKPVIFDRGMPTTFPAPTKTVFVPKLRAVRL
mmetsp:Transcript_135108/g.269609  ORF Transcript_135108/g.269609 Transcript_135108/m.269609 type:complete len:174 (-) Transcript_135108:70-591(-)